jgi:hypothetical protein
MMTVMAAAVSLSTLMIMSASPAENRPLAHTVMAQLREAVANRRASSVVALKNKWEEGWDNHWSLTAMSFEDVGWFQRRIGITWNRKSAGETRIRHDSFLLDGEFEMATEVVLKDEREIAGGRVFITQDGRVRYRFWGYKGTKLRSRVPHTAPMPEILYYELEVVDGGKVVSVYRSKLNFHVNPDTAEVEQVPANAVLVSGVKSPKIERLMAARRADEAKATDKQ